MRKRTTLPYLRAFGRGMLSTMAIIFSFFAFSCCLFAVVIEPMSNDRALDQFEAEFQKIEHPSTTSFVKREKQLGLLGGGGNGCRFFVGELRTYSQSKQAIQTSYANKEIETPFRSNVHVVFFENGKLTSPIGWYGFMDNLSMWSITETTYSENFYVAYVLSGDYSPGFDLRCN